jgi:hypothetical protein
MDAELAEAVQRLHELQVKGRWLLNAVLVLVLMPPSLWDLRSELQLWNQYFTWVAVRYGLAYHPLATLGLTIPIAFVTATLVWQSRNIIFGLSQREKYRLEKQATAIRAKGERHWLWRWIWKA